MGKEGKGKKEIDEYLSRLTVVTNEISKTDHSLDDAMEEKIAKLIFDFWMYQIEDKKIIADFYLTIGKAYVNNKKNNDALSSLKLAQEIYQELEIHEDEISSLNEIGRIFYMQGDYPEAEKYYNSVYDLVITQKLSNRQKSSALVNLANINSYKKKYQVAIDMMHEAIELIDENVLDDEKFEKYFNSIYFNLAINHLRLNDFNKSLHYYSLCENYWKNAPLLKNNLEELVYQLIDEVDDIEEILDEVIDLLLKLTDHTEDEIIEAITEKTKHRII